MSSTNSVEDLESISTLPLTSCHLPTQRAPSLTADVPLFCYDYRTSIEAIHEAVYRNNNNNGGAGCEIDQRSDIASYCTTLDDCNSAGSGIQEGVIDLEDLDLRSASPIPTLSGGGGGKVTPKQGSQTGRDIFQANKTYADIKRRPALAPARFSLDNVKLPAPKPYDPRSSLASKQVPTREIVVLFNDQDQETTRKLVLKPMPPQFTYTPPHLIAFKYKKGDGLEHIHLNITNVFRVVTAINEFSLTLGPHAGVVVDDGAVKMITFRLGTLSDQHETTLKQINSVWSSNLNPDPSSLALSAKKLTCLEFVANHNRKEKKKIELATPPNHYAPVVKKLNSNSIGTPSYGKRVVAVTLSRLKSSSPAISTIDPLETNLKCFKSRQFTTTARPSPDTTVIPITTTKTAIKEISPAQFYSSLGSWGPLSVTQKSLSVSSHVSSIDSGSAKSCLRVQTPDLREKVKPSSPKRSHETCTEEPEGGLVLGQGKIKRLSTIGKSYRETDLEAAGSLVTLASGSRKIPNHFFFTLNLPKHTKVLRYRPKSPNTTMPLQEVGAQPAASVDAIDLTYGDVCCLEENEFLNDTIIDFYLKYLLYEKLDPSLRNTVHIFTSFFYTRMTSRLKPPACSEKSGPIDDYLATTPSSSNTNSKCDRSSPINNEAQELICQSDSTGEIEELDTKTDLVPNSGTLQNSNPTATACLGVSLHQPVKKWTKNVDIFSKRFLIIPINKDSHWFLAIIYFETPPDQPNLDSTLPHTHIIILDSLATHSQYLVARNIRAYLTEEWRVKKKGCREDVVFDCTNTRSIYPKVPQQNNYHDCGPYLLHYVEVFFDNMRDFEVNDSSTTTAQRIRKHFASPAWSFLPIHLKDKRKFIVDLIIKLRMESASNGSKSEDSSNISSTKSQPFNPINKNATASAT